MAQPTKDIFVETNLKGTNVYFRTTTDIFTTTELLSSHDSGTFILNDDDNNNENNSTVEQRITSRQISPPSNDDDTNKSSEIHHYNYNASRSFKITESIENIENIENSRNIKEILNNNSNAPKSFGTIIRNGTIGSDISIIDNVHNVYTESVKKNNNIVLREGRVRGERGGEGGLVSSIVTNDNRMDTRKSVDIERHSDICKEKNNKERYENTENRNDRNDEIIIGHRWINVKKLEYLVKNGHDRYWKNENDYNLSSQHIKNYWIRVGQFQLRTINHPLAQYLDIVVQNETQDDSGDKSRCGENDFRSQDSLIISEESSSLLESNHSLSVSIRGSQDSGMKITDKDFADLNLNDISQEQKSQLSQHEGNISKYEEEEVEVEKKDSHQMDTDVDHAESMNVTFSSISCNIDNTQDISHRIDKGESNNSSRMNVYDTDLVIESNNLNEERYNVDFRADTTLNGNDDDGDDDSSEYIDELSNVVRETIEVESVHIQDDYSLDSEAVTIENLPYVSVVVVEPSQENIDENIVDEIIVDENIVDENVGAKNIENVENVENVENIENVENVENIENIENVENAENIENIENTDNMEIDTEETSTEENSENSETNMQNEITLIREDKNECDIDFRMFAPFPILRIGEQDKRRKNRKGKGKEGKKVVEEFMDNMDVATDWDPYVECIESVQRDENTMKLFLIIRWKNGVKTIHWNDDANPLCPQKILDFYESFIVFKERRMI
ncbi:hypothetical protein Glove_306g46 [Diversispora epigaea]|uniref:Chromo shadow domain-containing protein n=1 Tax=Diversispora epigaea TaxID=1348612 RepID=A0A397HU94_9GLOM|nr:hypothetical protein Glove_306g46 [Diversispora epigaea]